MTAIAILTYNRLETLQKALNSLLVHCGPESPIAIFEDCGQSDGTRKYLTSRMDEDKIQLRQDLRAVEYSASLKQRLPGTLDLGLHRLKAYLGTDNLGVAGNSNRALKWFMEETDADHLMLCNDDLEFVGDAAAIYAKAHTATDIDLFCFCDFTSPQYKCTPTTYRGTKLKKLSRMTGMMMSITRKLVESIGYFDPQFGRFGEEHCDYTVRARYAGHQNLFGNQQYCLDVDHTTIRHQPVASSVSQDEKPELDHVASSAMARKSGRYPYVSGYLPFTLIRNPVVDAMNLVGTETDMVSHHQVVN